MTALKQTTQPTSPCKRKAATATEMVEMPLSWCVLMADSRPYATSRPLQDWQQVARVNEHYASIHGSGFAYSQVGAGVSWDGKPKDAPACVHPDRGSRSAAWCKIPAIARVLLHGIGGRPRAVKALYEVGRVFCAKHTT